MLGAAGVGKTTLLKLFLASDEQGDKENIEEDDETTVKSKKTVSVLLDGEESLLEFLDNHDGEDPPFNPEATSSKNHVDSPSRHPNSDVIPFQCDAYAVVFALNDVTTLQEGRTTLCHLREDLGIDRAIFLVGNKSDLARQRHVSCEDACKLAHKYDCKYIETSAELGHRTDDLLVGILRHIRLKLSTSPGSENDVTDNEKTAAKKSHKWKKLSKLYKILHKSQHDVNSCSDVFL